MLAALACCGCAMAEQPAKPQASVAQTSKAPEAPDAKRPASPCETEPAFDQFDFWIGTWRVEDASGKFVGTNRIERKDGGCTVLELWTGAGGGSGSSINFYDPARERWVQVWSGAGGTQIRIEGGLEDGSMVLAGRIYYVGRDTSADFRGTWTPLADGRVRQYFEQRDEAGEWQPWFEGFYSRPPELD